jgi:phosphoserine aminotransferase
MGPSGVTLVVLRRSLLEHCDPDLPTMLRYGVHVEHGSMYNTPSTFGIYLIDRVCAWIEELGGINAIARRNEGQAAAIYEVIDNSEFWRGTCQKDSRSWMNITFTSGRPELDVAFCQQADKEGLSGLKGHRAVGGLRASLYNAQTDESVRVLVDFMRTFERTHG